MKEAENRFEITKRVGLFGIIGNIFLLSIKAIVGFSTKSQAMIADSINSAGDIFASIMTSIGNKIASVPRDDDHNFGHGKADRGKQLCFTGPSSAPIFSPVPRHGAFFIALYAASCRNTQVNLGQKIYFAIQSEVIAAGLFEQ